MTTTFGELATIWTVRIALAGYFIGGALWTRQASTGRLKLARIVWTLGCACYLAHVVSAFHFYHAWSHTAALERTAERTAETTGWYFGGGLYLNYLFTAVWVADALARWWPWFAGKCWPAIAVQLFLWFMVFNATVVFGHGAIRWFGLAGCIALPLAHAPRNFKMWTI